MKLQKNVVPISFLGCNSSLTASDHPGLFRLVLVAGLAYHAASPQKIFMHSTTAPIAKPGKVDTHHATSIAFLPSATIPRPCRIRRWM